MSNKSSNKLVLVVDDEPDICEILVSYLEEFGYQPEFATSGEEALQLIKNRDYLFVITDIDMPKINGLELISLVKGIKPFMPVGVCSAKVTEYATEIIKIAVPGSIEKPFTSDQLEQCVDNLEFTAKLYQDLTPSIENPEIKDLMTNGAYYLDAKTKVEDAIKFMAEKGVGSILIGDAENLKGIFTERDLLTKSAVFGKEIFSTSIENVMTKEPMTIIADFRVDQAMKILNDNNFRHLPITDGSKVIGIISVRDIILARTVALEEVVDLQGERLQKLQSLLKVG